jgi:glycolate oxidase iron-sulfur subunit
MQTTLSDSARQLPRAEEAESILRTCVHCGFCNATCPTYQLLGDELDGPRGRIYLIKQVLEGNEVTQNPAAPGPLPVVPQLRNHLPVRGRLPQPAGHRPRRGRRGGAAPARPALREGLRALVPHAGLFKGLVSGGQVFRALLPGTLQSKLPRSAPPGKARPTTRHARRC